MCIYITCLSVTVIKSFGHKFLMDFHFRLFTLYIHRHRGVQVPQETNFCPIFMQKSSWLFC